MRETVNEAALAALAAEYVAAREAEGRADATAKEADRAAEEAFARRRDACEAALAGMGTGTAVVVGDNVVVKHGPTSVADDPVVLRLITAS